MKKRLHRFRLFTVLFAVFMALSLLGCARQPAESQETISLAVVTETPEPESTVSEPESTVSLPESTEPESEKPEEDLLDPDGTYTTKEDVALYLYQYGELPQNFITKKEAKKLGWTGGGLDDYAYGMCIGGDYFGNYEGNLPKGTYHECDIDTLHKKKRGAKRIIYSDDGRIYYTDDHYETFTLLYGEEK